MLPLSVISFAEYFIYDEPEEAKRKRLTEATSNRRCLPSAAIFNVPFVRHLWTWLGLDPISRSRMLKMLRGGKRGDHSRRRGGVHDDGEGRGGVVS